MKHFKLVYLFVVVMMVSILGAKEADADCLSGRYGGPCAVWDNETCSRVCKEEGRTSGYCTASLKCFCRGC